MTGRIPMINVYHLSDAIPATLFGMFALWAAGSRCHWFVRMAVVSAALLIMLLIPAYEVVIEFGIGILLTVTGVAVWRRWRQRRKSESSAVTVPPARFRPQVSLETLMLLMVVVAVTTTVAARAPHFGATQWCSLVGIGVIMACIGLASVWLICGRTRWWVRLVAAPLLIVLLALVMQLLFVGQNLLFYWIQDPARLTNYWQLVRREGFWVNSDHWVPTISLSVSILCAWLILVRQAGWFDPFREADGQIKPQNMSTRSATIARWGAVVLFVLVSLFPLALLYRLMTPTPIPDLSAPRPNGFDELVAAGRMIGETDGGGLWRLRQLSDAQLRAWAAKNTEAYQLAHKALQGDCRFPLMGAPGNIVVDELRALYGLRDALYGRMKLASSGGSVDEQLAANLDLLRLTLFEARSNGTQEFTSISPFDYEAVNGLWQCRTAMTADECIALANELWQLEGQRAPWDLRVENQRIIAENSGWEWHLRSILEQWSGRNWYERGRFVDMLRRIEMRMLIVDLAIRAFQLKNTRLPATLEELTPDYLPVIPDDPYDDARPLKYCVTGGTYLLYSVGQNKVNDGEATLPSRQGQEGDDLVDADLFPAPVAQPAANAEGEGASEEQGEAEAEKSEP